MSEQNCRIKSARSAKGKTFVVLERTAVKNCDDLICKPMPVLGFPAETCEDCDRSN